MKRETIFSDDRKYRYTLWREWSGDALIGDDGGSVNALEYAMFIGLNPSTADETSDDPTIRRCIGFAKKWGYGALCMANLFAFRATDPNDMKKSIDPIGPENPKHLVECAAGAGIVIAAWGTHGVFMGRGASVKKSMQVIGAPIHHLGLSKDGHPKHPLYLRADTKPQAFLA